MAINKRIKSFSPYSYNAQYRRAGSNTSIKTAAYVNASTLQEAQYVVSKKDPKYNTFVTNNFIFTFDEQCNYEFVKAESIFQIELISNTQREKFDSVDYVFKHEHNEILLKRNEGFSWINNTTILTEDSYDYYFDYVLINGTEYVNDVEVSLTSEKKIKMKFNSHYDDLSVFLFKIEKPFNIFEEDVEINQISNVPTMNNKNGSLDVIPVIYDLNDKRYDLKYDISPNYISFMSGSIETIDDVVTQKNNIYSALNDIIENNQNVPTSVLYSENEEFQFNIDKLNLVLKKEEMIENSETNTSANVVKSFLYNCNDMIQYYAKYGQNTNSLKWNKNKLTISHNLNGYLKITVDYVKTGGINETLNKMNYSIKLNSMNEFEIDFKENEMSEYCITIFRI